jgi:rod shape-determining protein MreC
MKKINLKAIILFIATLGLLIFLQIIGALAPLERGVAFIFNPAAVRLQAWSSGFRLYYEEKLRQGDLAVENADLKKQISTLTAANASFKKTEEENSILRQHLKFLESGSRKKYILANIVSREVFNGAEESRGDLIIDKGRSDGVAPAAVVLNSEGLVVGKISEVGEKISHFILSTNSRCKFAAALQNSSSTIGLTSGNLGLTIDLNYIPQTEAVAVDDLAVTSGLEVGIPRGLVIGLVSKVDKSSNDIWQSANIQSLADFDDLMIVSVLIR